MRHEDEGSLGVNAAPDGRLGGAISSSVPPTWTVPPRARGFPGDGAVERPVEFEDTGAMAVFFEAPAIARGQAVIGWREAGVASDRKDRSGGEARSSTGRGAPSLSPPRRSEDRQRAHRRWLASLHVGTANYEHALPGARRGPIAADVSRSKGRTEWAAQPRKARDRLLF